MASKIRNTNQNATPQKSTWVKILMLLRPGDGQLHGNRCQMHDAFARRSAWDPQIWTHSFLFLASVVAGANGLYDLCTLLALTTPLSTLYHFDFEKPGPIAKIEGLMAKLMFVYGVLQLANAPSTMLLVIELLFLVATLIIFTGTNLCKEYYDPWHCLMHVVPAFWAMIVACHHTPLIAI